MILIAETRLALRSVRSEMEFTLLLLKNMKRDAHSVGVRRAYERSDDSL